MYGMTCKIVAGGIYKIPFPFSDLSSNKSRPVLSLNTPDSYGDVKFIFITSKQPQNGNDFFTLNEKCFEGKPLPLTSYLRLNKSLLLNKSLVKSQIAQLNQTTYERILRLLFAVDIPRFLKNTHPTKKIEPGKTIIPPSGKVIGATELQRKFRAQ